MSDKICPPAPHPCGSCPYRLDVPSGIWDLSEYRKLPAYDADTPYQPHGVFLCHQQDGRACAGWVATHDMDHCLALRLASSAGRIEDIDGFFDYETSTPLFDTGADAAAHGVKEIRDPSPKAQSVMEKLRQKQGDT